MRDRAGLFSERISRSPGRPRTAISRGTVMDRSTSSGERPGADVATCTWTFVTSGKASTESRLAASIPKASSAAAITATMTRCRSTSRIRPAIIGSAVPRLRQTQALVIQAEGAVENDLLVRRNSVHKNSFVARLLAQFDRRQQKAVFSG